MSYGGIVLAGGKSSRFGMDKGLTLFRGKPLIQYSIDVLKEVTDDIIIISGNKEYEIFGYQVIPDIVSGIGPLGGILTGLMKTTYSFNYILSCDTPFIDVALLKALKSGNGDHEIVVPLNSEGLYEPLCAIYSKSCISTIEMMMLENNFKVLDLFELKCTKRIKLDSLTPLFPKDIFANINTIQDFQNLQL